MPSASSPIRPAALAKRCTAVLATGAVLAAGLLAASPAVAAVAPPRLMVTEIVPNTTGPDDFEFFEVTNTTDAAIDLDAEGIRLHYTGVGAEPLFTRSAPAVVPAGGSVVFWLDYMSGDGVDVPSRTEAEFRAAFPDTAELEYPIVQVTGQAGMANGGGRGIRIVDAEGAEISESFYLAGQTGEQRGASFGVRAAGGTDLEFRAIGAPTPGAFDPALLEPIAAEPETPTPGAGSNAGDVWPLVVTEIMADNTGTDDYEYVEVVNTTDRDLDLDTEGIGFAYTYADDDLRDRDARYTLPAGTVIPAGEVAAPDARPAAKR